MVPTRRLLASCLRRVATHRARTETPRDARVRWGRRRARAWASCMTGVRIHGACLSSLARCRAHTPVDDVAQSAELRRDGAVHAIGLEIPAVFTRSAGGRRWSRESMNATRPGRASGGRPKHRKRLRPGRDRGATRAVEPRRAAQFGEGSEEADLGGNSASERIRRQIQRRQARELGPLQWALFRKESIDRSTCREQRTAAGRCA